MFDCIESFEDCGSQGRTCNIGKIRIEEIREMYQILITKN
jgi:hypothetical protein